MSVSDLVLASLMTIGELDELSLALSRAPSRDRPEWTGGETGTFLIAVLFALYFLGSFRRLVRTGTAVTSAVVLGCLGGVAAPIIVLFYKISPLQLWWLSPVSVVAGMLVGAFKSIVTDTLAELALGVLGVGIPNRGGLFSPNLATGASESVETVVNNIASLLEACCLRFYDECVSAISRSPSASRPALGVNDDVGKLKAIEAMKAYACCQILSYINNSRALNGQAKDLICAQFGSRLAESGSDRFHELLDRYTDESVDVSTQLIRFSGDVGSSITGSAAPINESLKIAPIVGVFLGSCKHAVGIAIHDADLMREAANMRDRYYESMK